MYNICINSTKFTQNQISRISKFKFDVKYAKISTSTKIPKNNGVVSAHMLKSEIDINRMRNKLLNQGANFSIKDKLVLVKSCDSLNHKSGTAILTQNGFLVLWGQSKDSLESYRSLVTESEEIDKIPLDSYHETLDFTETTGETRLCDGKILITNSDEREYDEIATSLALMTAVKLNFLEWDIKRNLEMRNTQLLSLKNSLVSQNLDRVAKALFELETYAHDCRYRLNLQGLLEYPDVLWDYDKQCDLFNRIQSLFEIPKRLDHLNHRISWTLETLNSYSEYVRHKHSSRLEKIIIALISIELLVGLIQTIISRHKVDYSNA